MEFGAEIDGTEDFFQVMTRAVEPDFKKSNKKPDAKVGYRRLYPTFAVKAAADVLAG